MEENEDQSSKGIDRPLECSECKRPIRYGYAEIVKGAIQRFEMCADCPQLEKHLYGSEGVDGPCQGRSLKAGLCCGHCGTTLESVRSGHPLGCTQCYEVFGDVLAKELRRSQKIPPPDEPHRKAPLHRGREPGEVKEISPSSRLMALHEALNETLRKEDYEQAAWLRDQIRELSEEAEHGSD